MARALILAAVLIFSAVVVLATQESNQVTVQWCTSSFYCANGSHCCSATTCCPNSRYCCGSGRYCCATSNSPLDADKIPALFSYKKAD